jgi:outer membrane protein TolC
LLLNDANAPIKTAGLEKLVHANLDVNSLIKLSVENRPFLEQIKLAEEKFKIKEDLAKYDYYPNFNFKLQYSQRDEISRTNTGLNDLVSFFVGFNLPLNYGGKVDAKVEEAKYQQQVFKNKFETSIQILRKSYGNLVSKLRELNERELLVEDGLIPQAEQSLKAALASYQVGDIDFLNVIDAQNRLYQIEIMLYNIRSGYQKTLANIEFLTGTKF